MPLLVALYTLLEIPCHGSICFAGEPIVYATCCAIRFKNVMMGWPSYSLSKKKKINQFLYLFSTVKPYFQRSNIYKIYHLSIIYAAYYKIKCTFVISVLILACKLIGRLA